VPVPLLTDNEEGCPGKQRTVVTTRWCMQHNGCVFQTVTCNWNKFCSGSHNTSYVHGTSHFQFDSKSTTCTTILHSEASFISQERGSRRGILSGTSLKHHIGFISFGARTSGDHHFVERLADVLREMGFFESPKTQCNLNEKLW